MFVADVNNYNIITNGAQVVQVYQCTIIMLVSAARGLHSGSRSLGFRRV